MEQMLGNVSIIDGKADIKISTTVAKTKELEKASEHLMQHFLTVSILNKVRPEGLFEKYVTQRNVISEDMILKEDKAIAELHANLHDAGCICGSKKKLAFDLAGVWKIEKRLYRTEVRYMCHDCGEQYQDSVKFKKGLFRR
jgi:hypothetical protein